MAANEFEKNVKKVIAEFKLHPSDEVWQNVEKRIGEKKRKRRVIFFILFSAIGLAIGTYGLYDYLSNPSASFDSAELKTTKTSQQEKAQQPETKENKNNDQTKLNTTANENPITIIAEKKLSTNKKQTKSFHKIIVKNVISQPNRENKITLTKPRKEIQKQTLNRNNSKEAEVSISDSIQKISSAEITVNNKPNPVNSENGIRTQQKSTERNSNISGNSLTKNEENKDRADTIQTKSAIKKQANSMGWKWGISFSAGSSKIAQDILSLSNDKSYNSTSYNNPGASQGSGQTFYPASSSKPSFSFKAGIVVKKNLTKRSSLSVGINYSYLADRIKTGIKIDSSLFLPSLYNAAYFYIGAPVSNSSTSQKEYTDRFHFIELPIIYDWRISGNANHFLSLNAGISLGYLFSAKALVYDTTAGGIYYHNKNLFTKTHFNILTGLSYHFAGIKKSEWSIGPIFSFDLDKTFNSELDKRKYFIYSGINANILFGNRKKK